MTSTQAVEILVQLQPRGARFLRVELRRGETIAGDRRGERDAIVRPADDERLVLRIG
jgi:hypothetical protein